jgi:hypothetical protein
MPAPSQSAENWNSAKNDNINESCWYCRSWEAYGNSGALQPHAQVGCRRTLGCGKWVMDAVNDNVAVAPLVLVALMF